MLTPSLGCFVAVFALAFSRSAADLGAAIRRSLPHRDVCLPNGPPLAGPLVVPLEKVPARDGSPSAFYVGKIAVGQPPQKLGVIFDTGSGNVLLPRRGCNSGTCVEHRRYSPWESSTAFDVNVDGTMVDDNKRLVNKEVNSTVGGGGLTDADMETDRTIGRIGFSQSDHGMGFVNSVLIRDHVCMIGSEEACVDIVVLAAISMDDVPFRAMPNDGIVGLGLESLSGGHLLSFMARLMEGSQNVLPQFGISFGNESGKIFFGGHDPDLTAPIQWFPVDHPEGGLWQVAIKSVRVGNMTVDTCEKGCHGVLDTTASRLGVQGSSLPKLRAALATTRMRDGSCRGQDLLFDLGGMVLEIPPQEYTDASCTALLGPMNLDESAFVGLYAFGASVLRSYYTAFDWANHRVGFALSASTRSFTESPKTLRMQSAVLV